MRGSGALGTRVLTATTLLMIAFFALAFLALDLAFRRAAESALEQVLESQVLGLLAAADPADGNILTVPEALPETRFSRPGSGLYGQVIDDQGETIWLSRSALGIRLPTALPEEPGEIRFALLELNDGTPVLGAALKIEWEFDNGESAGFVFAAASGLDGLHAQIARFRNWLGGGFGLLLLLLLGVQLVMLRYLMRPLRQAETEIRNVRAGMLDKLSDGYPAEIQALSGSINLLIDSERSRTRRYRESLTNLAHSLKTPLAVIRSYLDSGRAEPEVLDQHLQQIHDIVDYQLGRAAAAGPAMGGERCAVAPAIREVVQALTKAHHRKTVNVTTALDEQVLFPGGRGDLLEVLGNVLDNAFKFCRSQVRVRVYSEDGDDNEVAWLNIVVEDDGPGLTEDDRAALLGRGVRGPGRQSGHGIGLAVVADIVESAGGAVSLDDSDLGGARIAVSVPLTGRVDATA